MSTWVVLWTGAGLWAPAPAWSSDVKPSGANTYQKVTGDDSEEDRQRWDTLYSTGNYIFGKEPSAFLKEHVGLLPLGRALDIAMGEGRNAVFMAKKGFRVDGVDISEVALRKAKRLAREQGTTLTTINADLNHYQIRAESYDVILNIDYLQRSLVPQIKKGLKRGGVIVYENFTVDQMKNVTAGQRLVRDYLLERGELKDLFKDFKILVYRERNDGREARAQLVARKP